MWVISTDIYHIRNENRNILKYIVVTAPIPAKTPEVLQAIALESPVPSSNTMKKATICQYCYKNSSDLEFLGRPQGFQISMSHASRTAAQMVNISHGP